MPAPGYIVALLMTLCFTLGTSLELHTPDGKPRGSSDGMLNILFGDGKRMFANYFFVKADVYFHSGYYPSIFDQQAKKAAQDTRHMMRDEHDHDQDHDHDADHDGKDHDEEEHEKAMDFLGQPHDWIDGFGRHFFPSRHSHLDNPGDAREILPWLRISADLDPQRIETYTVASFWLRTNMKKVDEAEQFLREGLRANPRSFEILYELGDIYYTDRHDSVHARNLWELAVRYWEQDHNAGKDPDELTYRQTTAKLAHLEEAAGNLARAIQIHQLEKQYSPEPEKVQGEIDDLKKRLAAGTNSVPSK